MNKIEQNNMPGVLDRAISDSSQDAFGHHHFANALRNLIETESYKPPFSIGLLGPWGSGKSTIKELYLADLDGDRTGVRGKQRKDHVYPITFNAWRYGGEDIKRSLLRHAFLALGGNESNLRRELYQQVSKTSQTRRSFWDWSKEAILQNLTSVLIFLLLLAGTLALALIFERLVGITGNLSLTFLASLTLVLAGFLAKYVVDIRLQAPAFFTPTTTISFPLTSAEEYEQLLINQLKEFKGSKKGSTCKRLVVFVDDLDRLSAAEMVAGLDAIRSFLEIPTATVADAPGVIFVISCDEDRVAEALARGGGRVKTDLPGSVFTRSDARRYLDRLFQFRLEIPPFPKLDMRQFAKNKLLEMDVIVQDLDDHGVLIQDLLERLIHVGVQSPRNAIQIINAFAQSWWIAKQRERSGIGSNAPGALHKGAVTDHPLSLAALCVLRVDFPDFFNNVQKRPELLKEINSVLFRKGDIKSLPIDAKQALKDFLVLDTNGNLTSDIRPEFRELRRYLSSIQGLRWPERLQPLLLLAEDSITRRYGDKAALLHDAFVSGDTRGVLETFGREFDTSMLAPEDILLLEDLVEEVNQDTDVRKINAARVLADLAPRVSEEYARGLMTPLARQLIDYKEVRMNIGPKASKDIILHTEQLDQQEVAKQFCFDLLRSEIIEWRLPNGESPNLEEIVQIVKDAVDLALYVRKNNGLMEKADLQLRSWLLTRDIRIEKQSLTLPFSELERWVAEYGESLLYELGADYTDQVVAEFEADQTNIEDINSTISRVDQVFSRLAHEGQESRIQLWEQLARMIAVHSREAVYIAQNTAKSYSDLASDRQADAFLRAMADRLQKEMVDEDNEWELDWQRGGNTFLDLLTQWSKWVDTDTADATAELVVSWSDVDETAEFGSRGCRLLEQTNSSAWSSVIDHFVSKPFGELPWEARKVLAEELEQVSDAQKNSLVVQLNQVINTDDIKSEVAEDYVNFVKATPVSAWKSNPLQSHLIKLFSRLETMFNNQHEYLSKLFSAGVALFGGAPNGRVGQFLNQLFTQAVGSPAAYPVIHKEMIGAWPEESDEIGSYGPPQIVERAVQFIEQHQTAVGVGFVFESIVDLVDHGLATENVYPRVARAVVVLWPYSPSSVYKCISRVAELLSPKDVREILTGTQPSDKTAELEVIVNLVAKQYTEEKCMTTVRELLSVNPIQFNAHPDGAVMMWLKALRSKESTVLDKLLQADDLNDVQKERLYQYALNRKVELGIRFFIIALPWALGHPDNQRVLEVAVKTSSEIGELALTNDDKAELYNKIIPMLPRLSGENLVEITRLVRRLGGKGAIERASQVISEMDDEDLSIMADEMPDSKILKRILKARREQSQP